MVSLEIISDPICPWCYIGKARLDRALEQRPQHLFEITWRPFQLNPDMPKEGMDRREYLELKFGREGAIKAYTHIEQMAKASGLDIHFEKIQRTPNTLDAHRLIRWARDEHCQTPLVGQLFRRYFREGQDISDHDVLADAAASVGMDREMTARLLASDNDVAEVRAEDRGAREMGVQGVPLFLVARKYALSGAQETDLWLQAIDEIVEREKEAVG
jgi:predicted DsbA family dithiol-disulfide isomerase